MKRLIAVLSLLLLLTGSAEAIQIKYSTKVPYPELHITKPKQEVPNKAVVQKEVYHLEKQFPFLKNQWTLNVITARAFYREDKSIEIAGMADGESKTKAYIFSFDDSNNQAAYVIAHEIGHLVGFNYVNVKAYKKFRGNPKEDADELFAEDFMWLFGSSKARFVGYWANAKKPGKREKDYILKRLRKVK